ncbi:3-ketoacyl-CoA thiolase, mitochondrial [Lingula anatina]|uniref:3-ketoacyl-CoA thiolase, mitochondrial n=1 Tax=Lingula anatina TaxID=7574 RepID=A0A1S3JJX2_LINAN|nr:3-ketoacyl-CoA thiolase, mitochondrial [Lingula anatina]|eukprot:XP_013410677.1 3-ketoacyl-CoA thiolase, mitochondrial [Lingula anatina]
MASRAVFIVAAKRTAFGTFGGKLKNKTATDLCEIAAAGALHAGNVHAEAVDSVIVGNVCASAADGAYISRHVGTRIGVPISSPALTVNRLCGSGFQAIINGAHEILLNESQVVLCGGSENMSQAPYALRNMRFGTQLGVDYKLEDTLWGTLTDWQIKTPMGMTAENLADRHGITRAECDAVALRSQLRWAEAAELRKFDDEIVPVRLEGKKGEELFERDEHPRQTTMQALEKLPPVFKKGGTVTAGNASGICDGAAAVVLASEEAVKTHNLTPLARLAGYHVSGCDPHIMGIGPVPAIEGLLKKTGMKLADMGLIEVNEAFAAQYLAVERELGLHVDITNVNGGAIALGHPVGASGTRITTHLVYEMRRRKTKHSIGSACIGGGQGIALLLEGV